MRENKTFRTINSTQCLRSKCKQFLKRKRNTMQHCAGTFMSYSSTHLTVVYRIILHTIYFVCANIGNFMHVSKLRLHQMYGHRVNLRRCVLKSKKLNSKNFHCWHNKNLFHGITTSTTNMGIFTSNMMSGKF